MTGRQSTALNAPSSAYQRAEKKVKKMKIEALYRNLRETRPELSEAEVRRLVEQTSIVIKPDEVPKKFPLKPVIAILYTAGGLLALRRIKSGMSDSMMRISPQPAIFTVALAGAVLGLLAWTGGWIYLA